MKIHAGFRSWNGGKIGPTVATLGNFDGVHLGHRAILDRVLEQSGALSLPSVVVTFDPVPRKVLIPETAPPLIQTLEQRLRCLEELGIEHTIVVAFDLDFSRKSPQEFVTDFLVNCLHVRKFIVGQNFTFGYRKQGTLELLRQMGQHHGFEVEGILEIKTGAERISSTLIREKLRQGQMDEAARFLGRPFALIGEIVQGERLGGTIGIPTANLKVENELLPAHGVYVSRALVGSSAHPSVTNIGTRPTVGGRKLTVEAHLIGFSGTLYGDRMELQLLHKIRDEMRFSGIEQLKAQILRDIETARTYFSAIS